MCVYVYGCSLCVWCVRLSHWLSGSLSHQIIASWRNRTCRLFCQKDTRRTSMTCREDMRPGESTATGVPVYSRTCDVSSDGPDSVFQSGCRCKSQRRSAAGNGSDENQTPGGADGAAQETRRGQSAERHTGSDVIMKNLVYPSVKEETLSTAR